MTQPGEYSGRGNYDLLYRRYIDLQKQVEHLSILREVALAVTVALEYDEALPIIANVVQGALDLKRVTIYEYDKPADYFKPVIAKYGQDLITPDRLEEESTARRGSAIGQAFESKSVHLINTPNICCAFVPLVAKNEPLGVMVLQDKQDGQEFTNDDTVLYRQLGAQIAVSIHNAQLYAMAVTDGLTGLYVRRYFDIRLEEQFAQAERYSRPFSLMLFDIDHFKKFNDTHGHQTGDAVLQQFAQVLKDNTRQSDICCRYGGEEMTIVLPETPFEDAAVLANKLCARIRKHVFIGTDDQELHVTTSIGVSAYLPDFTAADEMVQAADKALYEAKELGRNRVQLAD